MLYKKKTLWLAIGLAAGTQVHAQQRLDDVQVTANRLPQTQGDVLASTTIIDREEIERLQASSVVELLQGRAGIEITQNGTPGSQTSLFLRGSESDHSVILVDGVRINSATSGGASLEFLPPEAIERIEIVRGPRAAAYGADAIGGVIQIFTRRNATPGTHASLSARAGSDDTYRQNAWVATGGADTRLNASLFHHNSDGFNATHADNSGERDGFERKGAQLGLSHRFSDTVNFDINALRQNFDTQYDDCYPTGSFIASQNCITKGYLQTFGSQLDIQLADNWLMSVTGGHFDEQREARYEDERQSLIESHRDELGLQHRFIRSNGVDALGIDYRHDSIDFSNRAGQEYGRDSRENIGIYATILREYGAHELSSSLRYDDDSLFGDETTGNLGYAYRLTPTQRLGVSYGTAFKAPNLIDLYGPYGTNPGLEAETSHNVEAFWSIERSSWGTRITAFENKIDDLINYDPNTFLPYNVDKARIRGVELSSNWQSGGLTLNAALTFQDPEDRATGERLKRRAKHFARIDADYRLGNWNFGTTLRGASNRRDTQAEFPYGDTQVSGYGLVDLRTSWQVTPMIELSAKLENAFDKQYRLIDGYNTRDRYLEGGVTLHL